MRVADLFAGSGGTSLGAELAGATVVYAANHSPFAVATHQLNHPNALHVCQDLRQANWGELPAHDLLWASPACQVYSPANAKKKTTRHDGDRATAWAVIDCADINEPRAIAVENTPEFRRWRLYPEWKSALSKLGYSLSEHIIRASHHGVPQRRDRLFVLGIKSGRTPYFHRSMTETPFGPCVDWAAEGWRDVSKASVDVRDRIDRGRSNHGRTFLTQHTTNHPGTSLAEPIRTITTADQWALVDGDRYRTLTIVENLRAQSFPDTYQFPAGATRKQCIRGIGNAVAPFVARDVVRAVMEAA